jgi:hypothetical protein
MDAAARRWRAVRAGKGASSPPSGTGRRHRGLIAGASATGIVIACLLVACSPESGAAGPTPSATSSEGGEDVMNDPDSSGRPDRESAEAASEVIYADLMADPQAHLDTRIRVEGNVFFFPECPPPGSSTAKCTLLGYLVDPEQRTFIAADTSTALPLMENGIRVACDESGDARPACAGWTADATYTLEGVLVRQVLGGRETDLIQFDVTEKSEPQPW